MKKAMVLALMFICVFVAPALSANRPERTLGLGAGNFAGMIGVSAGLISHVPATLFGTNDLYIRTGLIVTDSKSLTPDKDWRKFLPVYIDVMYYFYENMYLGAGLNYPIMVSDKETGNIGSQVYLGMDMDPGASLGKGYIEVGWGSLNRMDADSFNGLIAMIGLRYDIIPDVQASAQKAVKEQAQPVEKQIQPVVAAPVITQVVTKEVLQDPKKIKKLINLDAEIETLKIKFIAAQNYVTLVNNKIAKAKKDGDQNKASQLNSLKSDAVIRMDLIGASIEQKQTEVSIIENQN